MTITGEIYIQYREGVIVQPSSGVFIANMVLIVVRFLSPVLVNDYLYGSHSSMSSYFTTRYFAAEV